MSLEVDDAEVILDDPQWRIVKVWLLGLSSRFYKTSHYIVVHKSRTDPRNMSHPATEMGKVKNGSCATCGRSIPKHIIAMHEVLTKL